MIYAFILFIEIPGPYIEPNFCFSCDRIRFLHIRILLIFVINLMFVYICVEEFAILIAKALHKSIDKERVLCD